MRDGELIVKAASIAASAHLAQQRTSLPEPYINHPLRVAVAAEECNLPPEVIAAALLHDVVEDTSLTLHDLHHCGFPPRTIQLVRLLSKWWKDDAPAAEKAEGKIDYYLRICDDLDAVALKLLDRADNLLDMVKCLPGKRDWAESYLRKTDKEFGVLLWANRSAGAVLRFHDARGRLVRALGLFHEVKFKLDC